MPQQGIRLYLWSLWDFHRRNWNMKQRTTQTSKSSLMLICSTWMNIWILSIIPSTKICSRGHITNTMTGKSTKITEKTTTVCVLLSPCKHFSTQSCTCVSAWGKKVDLVPSCKRQTVQLITVILMYDRQAKGRGKGDKKKEEYMNFQDTCPQGISRKWKLM